MKAFDVDVVSECIGRSGITHVIRGDVIWVDRDSICRWDTKGDENSSYQALLNYLNTVFMARFAYVAKTDDSLVLDKVEKPNHNEASKP